MEFSAICYLQDKQASTLATLRLSGIREKQEKQGFCKLWRVIGSTLTQKWQNRC